MRIWLLLCAVVTVGSTEWEAALGVAICNAHQRMKDVPFQVMHGCHAAGLLHMG